MQRRSDGPMPGFDAIPTSVSEMRAAYGAPFASVPQQVGPLPGWGPPNPVVMPMLVPLRGHPYVWCRSLQNAYGTWNINCTCRACGETYERECQFPAKSGSWIAWFAAHHCHDDEQCRAAWTDEYHRGLVRLRQASGG